MGEIDSSEFVPNFVTNFGLVVAGASAQDAAARAFVQQAVFAAQAKVGLFGSFDVTYVGHSLGGFLAQTASASGSEGEVVAFNAPGAGGFTGAAGQVRFSADVLEADTNGDRVADMQVQLNGVAVLTAGDLLL